MDWRTHLDLLAEVADGLAATDETWMLWLDAERTGFVRVNRAAVRQAGDVDRGKLVTKLVRGKRQASLSWTLSGSLASDSERLTRVWSDLRDALGVLPEDPYLLLPTERVDTEQLPAAPLPNPLDAASAILDAARSGTPLDLVGILAAGPVMRGLRTSWGQRNWMERRDLSFNASAYHPSGRAVKRSWAWERFDAATIAPELAAMRGELALLGRDPIRIEPGAYRAVITAAAGAELFDLLTWDGFSARAQAEGVSCLRKLAAGEVSLHPDLHVSECPGLGAAPRFQADGFVKPDRVALIEAGKHAGALVSPRTAVERGLPSNGASADEIPTTLRVAAGSLPQDQLLQRLGDGVWVSNFWYANHSDRATARMTGMTRFATFWVEGGERVAPLEPMRFDDSFYSLWGAALEGIGDRVSQLPSDSTYGGRELSSMELPDTLVSELRMTL